MNRMHILKLLNENFILYELCIINVYIYLNLIQFSNFKHLWHVFCVMCIRVVMLICFDFPNMWIPFVSSLNQAQLIIWTMILVFQLYCVAEHDITLPTFVTSCIELFLFVLILGFTYLV